MLAISDTLTGSEPVADGEENILGVWVGPEEGVGQAGLASPSRPDDDNPWPWKAAELVLPLPTVPHSITHLRSGERAFVFWF